MKRFFVDTCVTSFSKSLSIVLRCRDQLLSMLHKVNSNSNHCLLSELPSAYTRVRHTLAATTAHRLVFEVSRCRTSQFARYFLTAQDRICMELPSLRYVWHRNICFFSVFCFAGACGVANVIYKKKITHLGLFCWFYYNNNNLKENLKLHFNETKSCTIKIALILCGVFTWL